MVNSSALWGPMEHWIHEHLWVTLFAVGVFAYYCGATNAQLRAEDRREKKRLAKALARRKQLFPDDQ